MNYLYLGIVLLSSIASAAVTIHIRNNRTMEISSKRNFVAVGSIISVVPLIEFLTVLIDGNPALATLDTYLITIELILVPFPASFMAYAIGFEKAGNILRIISCVFALFVLACSPFGVLFTVDSGGYFVEKPLYIIVTITFIIAEFIKLALLGFLSKRFENRDRMMLVMISIIPLVTIVISFYNGLSALSFMSFALGFCLIYIYYSGLNYQIEHHELQESTQKLKEEVLQSVQVIANALDDHSVYSKDHVKRVSAYSTLIAERVGYSEEELEKLRVASLLYHVGMVAIPDSILYKQTKLTDAEEKIYKKHARLGYDILSKVTLLPEAAEIALRHHEHYDGTGYPGGLSGEDIPMNARIVQIADAYDEMYHDKPQRPALTKEMVRYEIKTGAGNKFDPKLCELVISMMDQGELNIFEE